MVKVTNATLPTKRRFTFPGFTNSWRIFTCKSLPQYTDKWTIRNRSVEDKHKSTSYLSVDEYYTAWSSNKSQTQIIKCTKQYALHTDDDESLETYYSSKKWVFGSNKKETNTIKANYQSIWNQLSILCNTDILKSNKKAKKARKAKIKSKQNDEKKEQSKETTQPQTKQPQKKQPETPMINNLISYRRRTRSMTSNITPITELQQLSTDTPIPQKKMTNTMINATNIPTEISVLDTNGVNQIYVHKSQMMVLIGSILETKMASIIGEVAADNFEQHQNTKRYMKKIFEGSALSQKRQCRKTIIAPRTDLQKIINYKYVHLRK